MCLGPKWLNLGIRGGGSGHIDEFRAYLWTARHFIGQISDGETLPNGAAEFRAPEKSSGQFRPF